MVEQRDRARIERGQSCRDSSRTSCRSATVYVTPCLRNFSRGHSPAYRSPVDLADPIGAEQRGESAAVYSGEKGGRTLPHGIEHGDASSVSDFRVGDRERERVAAGSASRIREGAIGERWRRGDTRGGRGRRRRR